MLGLLPLLGFLFVGILTLASIALQIYGTILAFQKKWYIGLAALIFPVFAVIVGLSKVFKKDFI